jgi:putative iron-dependent peroxidase
MVMSTSQSGILAEVPRLARYLFFSWVPKADPKEALKKLADLVDGDSVVVGIGQSVVMALGKEVDGLRIFTPQVGGGVDVPSTPFALWCWIRGTDRGELLHQSRMIRSAVASAFRVAQVIDGFQFRDSRDLGGYEDGTENPKGDDAVAAALVSGVGDGVDGSSFVAVQQWVHDLDRFESMSQSQRDHTFGRRLADNEEIEDAPDSAHVKRTAQEDFEPEAFVVRRSMPWAGENREGLVFVAFGKSFDAFEALLHRMMGQDDGVLDALFTFTYPVSGSYFWCPPMKDGQLDLRAVGL